MKRQLIRYLVRAAVFGIGVWVAGWWLREQIIWALVDGRETW